MTLAGALGFESDFSLPPTLDSPRIAPLNTKPASAAPQVAALAARVRALRPDLKAADVIRLIEQGADDIGAPGFDEKTGYGRINFLKTLELARTAAKR
jgi:hypothetical protein